MIIVIACAGGKNPDAGYMKTLDGHHVNFVGNPPEGTNGVYARPDDMSDTGVTWREQLVEYNRNPNDNPLGLLPAWKLYKHPIYVQLVEKFGLDKVFILSAGWGLISSNFFTPVYNITFSKAAGGQVHRRPTDHYADMNMLSDATNEKVVFLGGGGYVPLFSALTAKVQGERVVYYSSKKPPLASGCTMKKYHRTFTNWHYECAKEVIAEKNGN